MAAAQQVAALLVLAWLPGALLYRVPLLGRERREQVPGDERLFWSVILSVALSLSGVLALAAVERYSYPRLLAANLLVSAVLLTAFRGRLRMKEAQRSLGGTALALVLVGAALWRFTPPAEYVIGGKDPGTYVNEGVQIAQRGTLLIHDPVVASVPRDFRDLFFPSHERQDYYGLRFQGFFIQTPDDGTVVGQFPHLLPAGLAIGYGIDGLTGVRRTTPVFAALGVVAVYFAGTALFGRLAGLAGAVLLLLNVITVWFGRYPNSEVVMQALLFASLLALWRWHADEDEFFAAIAGALLGLLMFLRFDAVLAIGAASGGLLLSVLTGRRFPLAFVAGLALPLVASALYLAGPMRAYAYLPLEFIRNMPFWQHVSLLVVATAAAAALAGASRSERTRAVIERTAPTVVAAALVAAAGYGLWFREAQGRLAFHDAYALRMYASFYVTLPVLLAAVIGFAVYARGAFWRAPAFYVVAAVFAFFFFYKMRIVPEHFWATRRWLAVILPSTMLLAAAAAVGGRGFGPLPVRVVRRTLGLAFLVLVSMHYVRASRPVEQHVEYAGLIPHLERLAGQIGDRDLVVVESRDAGGDTHVFGLPLAYIYAKQVLVLNSARPDKATFAAFISWARSRHPRVLFIGGGGTDLLSFNYAVRPVVSDRFQVPEYDSAPNAHPRFVRQKEFEYTVYQFADPAPRLDGLWFDLDLGVNDDLHVLRFQAKEQTDGRSFRWTRARSAISVTAVSPGIREITLVMADGGRPDSAPAAAVTVFFHNQNLGTITVDGGFRPYTVAIPPELAARAAALGEPVELRLVTETWNPARVLGGSDDRDLGVMVDRVTVR